MNTRSQFKEKHGNIFSFDMFLAEECWTDPGAVEKHLRLNKQARKAHDGEAWKLHYKNILHD